MASEQQETMLIIVVQASGLSSDNTPMKAADA
jgi:hypothetical protein